MLDTPFANPFYRHVDVHMNECKHPTERLLRMSRTPSDVYAFLFLDCPAGMSLHEEVIATTRERFPAVLATEIPYRSEIERIVVRCEIAAQFPA